MTPDQLTTELVDLAARFTRDPLRWVLAAFPWGEPGTDLAEFDGPDEWQRDLLQQIGAGLLSPQRGIQAAISSGHGVGKSAFIAWVVLWSLTTCEDARAVVTANTATQLATKTWPELVRWHRMCLWRDWFTVSATAIFAADPAHAKTWRADAIPWSENNTEAFAGLHNKGKRILVVYDEASAIPELIFQTTEGALTDADTDIIWLVAGNPTRNTGRFRECFGRLKHRWVTRQIDSRAVRVTNKAQIAQWVQDYGEDSDFVRVRVRGVFPRAGAMQFIGSDLIEAARLREPVSYPHDPLVIGVDVGRQGDDQTVIYVRKGRDARTLPIVKMRVPDLMAVAARVKDLADQHRADMVFVDGGGIGAGVVDRLRQLRMPGLREVQFGAAADRGDVGQADKVGAFANKRAEMWGTMRAWLAGGSIADDAELQAELAAVEFGHDAQDRIQLERKRDMKKRGLASPDVADALALTFAYPVTPSALAGSYPAFVRPQQERQYQPHGRV